MTWKSAPKWMARVAAAIWILGATSTAFAQGCAMCYTAAAAARAAAIRALQSGILILLIPPALMFIGIFVWAFRSRERFNDPNPEDLALDRELSDLVAAMAPNEERGLETVGDENPCGIESTPRLASRAGLDRDQLKP